MANEVFYEKIAPDFGDPENSTSRCPGFRLEIVERDIGIGIGLSKLDAYDHRMGLVNPDEAEEIVKALQGAIKLAREKQGDWPGHPRRVREP